MSSGPNTAVGGSGGEYHACTHCSVDCGFCAAAEVADRKTAAANSAAGLQHDFMDYPCVIREFPSPITTVDPINTSIPKVMKARLRLLAPRHSFKPRPQTVAKIMMLDIWSVQLEKA